MRGSSPCPIGNVRDPRNLRYRSPLTTIKVGKCCLAPAEAGASKSSRIGLRPWRCFGRPYQWSPIDKSNFAVNRSCVVLTEDSVCNDRGAIGQCKQGQNLRERQIVHAPTVLKICDADLPLRMLPGTAERHSLPNWTDQRSPAKWVRFVILRGGRLLLTAVAFVVLIWRPEHSRSGGELLPVD
jgi:hypothetical protein